MSKPIDHDTAWLKQFKSTGVVAVAALLGAVLATVFEDTPFNRIAGCNLEQYIAKRNEFGNTVRTNIKTLKAQCAAGERQSCEDLKDTSAPQ